jgi:hypothetical protein
LTTNKLDDFDEAIRNRVQLEIGFDEMTPVIRRDIWRNLIRCNAHAIDIDEIGNPEVLEVLSQFKVNGREMKNLLRLAACCARADPRQLKVSLKHLVGVMKVKYAHGELGSQIEKLCQLVLKE